MFDEQSQIFGWLVQSLEPPIIENLNPLLTVVLRIWVVQDGNIFAQVSLIRESGLIHDHTLIVDVAMDDGRFDENFFMRRITVIARV